ncbi:uncharacterized protein TRIADDRAFT_23231, partial [Trichoplax adhaerens]
LFTASPPYTVHFMIKFYAADPCSLEQELTRYLFFQQVKNDAQTGRLPCNFADVAQLGAYVLQAELGDYNPQVHTDGYVSEFRFVPKQSEELEDQVMEYHKTVS